MKKLIDLPESVIAKLKVVAKSKKRTLKNYIEIELEQLSIKEEKKLLNPKSK